FYSFKTLNLRRSVPFIFVVAVAIAFAVISYDTPVALFGLFIIYALSGYVQALLLIKRKSSGQDDQEFTE
ncbi:MAG TPA: CDP-diacylglycerol--serine O-phosphatidyltransferase, partial [Accumulibacter sp.]|nr:CDP-diacylglycerol--serine O-phosphatidyltransferase [Accumulibacter sp.]